MDRSHSPQVRWRPNYRPQLESLEERRTPSGIASVVSTIGAFHGSDHALVAPHDPASLDHVSAKQIAHSSAAIEQDHSTAVSFGGAKSMRIDFDGENANFNNARSGSDFGGPTAKAGDALQDESGATDAGPGIGMGGKHRAAEVLDIDAGSVANVNPGATAETSSPGQPGQADLGIQVVEVTTAPVGDGGLRLTEGLRGSAGKLGELQGAEGQPSVGNATPGGNALDVGLGLLLDLGTNSAGSVIGRSSAAGTNLDVATSASPGGSFGTPVINLPPAGPAPGVAARPPALGGMPLAGAGATDPSVAESAAVPPEMPAAGGAADAAPAAGSGSIRESGPAPMPADVTAELNSPGALEADLVTRFQPVNPAAVGTVMRRYLEQVANLGDELTSLLGSVGPSAWIMIAAITITAYELAHIRQRQRAARDVQLPLRA